MLIKSAYYAQQPTAEVVHFKRWHVNELLKELRHLSNPIMETLIQNIINTRET